MDPASLALGGAGAILGPIFGLIGQLFAKGDRDAALRLRQQAMDQFNISLPPVEHIAAQQVASNPDDAQAQRGAYQELMRQGMSGELRPTERARLNEIQNTIGQQERGTRDAITQSMQARGMGGSGSELAAQLSNQQASNQNASQQGLQVAAQADQRQMAALTNGAELARAVRGQDLQEGTFNANQRAATNVFNVGQDQQHFQNQMGLAGARAAAQNNMADTYDNRGNQTQGMWGGMGQGLGGGASAMGQAINQNDLFNKWLETQRPQTGARP